MIILFALGGIFHLIALPFYAIGFSDVTELPFGIDSILTYTIQVFNSLEYYLPPLEIVIDLTYAGFYLLILIQTYKLVMRVFKLVRG